MFNSSIERNNIELENIKKNEESGDELGVVDSFATRKRKALSEIDNAKFGSFHVRAILVSGVGFFTVKLIKSLILK